jgi:hypothetical protein
MTTLLQRVLHLASHSRGVAEFCDSCAHVCDPACRAASVRDQARTHSLRLGARI